MNPISTSTLGMSAARSTMNPAWRDGCVSRPTPDPRDPTTFRAMRTEPDRVSYRTRLPRMLAMAGGMSRKLGPPKRSALFSRRASAAVWASDAVSDRV